MKQALYYHGIEEDMKSWKCQICGKLNCWGLFEIQRGPVMCEECWEKKLEEEVEENETL